MSLGAICWALSAFIFLLLGFDVISSTEKVHLDLIAFGLVPLGLLLSGFAIPVVMPRRPPE